MAQVCLSSLFWAPLITEGCLCQRTEGSTSGTLANRGEEFWADLYQKPLSAWYLTGPVVVSSLWYCAGSGTGGDMVDGKDIGSCLGDEFSVRWMEDTDSANLKSETVGQQFTKIQTAVTKSHVQEYGVTSFDSEPIGDFEGNMGTVSVRASSAMEEGNGVDSRQVEVHQAYYQVMRAKTAAARKEAEGELSAILSRRSEADAKFGEIALVATGDAAKAQEMLEGNDFASRAVTENSVACHKKALEETVKYCGAFNDYSLRYGRLFANLCHSVEPEAISSAIKAGCGQRVVV